MNEIHRLLERPAIRAKDRETDIVRRNHQARRVIRDVELNAHDVLVHGVEVEVEGDVVVRSRTRILRHPGQRRLEAVRHPIAIGVGVRVAAAAVALGDLRGIVRAVIAYEERKSAWQRASGARALAYAVAVAVSVGVEGRDDDEGGVVRTRIAVVADVSAGGAACLHRLRRIAVAVAVAVEVVGVLVCGILDVAIAVVVDAEGRTELRCAGIDRSAAVIAVCAVGHISRGPAAGLDGHIGAAVRVVVRIAEVGRCVSRIARVAIAVVVYAEGCAQLRSAGEDCVRRVVAVDICGGLLEVSGVRRARAEQRTRGQREAVAVRVAVELDLVGRARVHIRRAAVAVVVHAHRRAQLRRAGVLVASRVVAVERARRRCEIASIRRAGAEQRARRQRESVAVRVAVELDTVRRARVHIARVTVAVVVHAHRRAQLHRSGVLVAG